MQLMTIDSKQPYEVLGLVRGSTVQCKNFGRDFMAGLKGLVGGEVAGYTELMDEAREIATNRMMEQAKEFGADAILGIRYTSAEITEGAAEVMVYGTAVKWI